MTTDISAGKIGTFWHIWLFADPHLIKMGQRHIHYPPFPSGTGSHRISSITSDNGAKCVSKRSMLRDYICIYTNKFPRNLPEHPWNHITTPCQTLRTPWRQLSNPLATTKTPSKQLSNPLAVTQNTLEITQQHTNSHSEYHSKHWSNNALTTT